MLRAARILIEATLSLSLAGQITIPLNIHLTVTLLYPSESEPGTVHTHDLSLSRVIGRTYTGVFRILRMNPKLGC